MAFSAAPIPNGDSPPSDLNSSRDPNQPQRPGWGLALQVALPVLKLACLLLRGPAPAAPAAPESPDAAKAATEPGAEPGGTLLVFKATLVGDFFMALPALKLLAQHHPIVVAARPDTLVFLREAGIPGIPFDNAFFLRPSWRAAWRTFLSARRVRAELRRQLPSGIPPFSGLALDLDADPRTAFWLKAMGVHRAVSWHRRFGHLFDATYPLPTPSRHQREKDWAAARGFLERGERYAARFELRLGKKASALPSALPPSSSELRPSTGPWLVGVFTRKDVKNWPWEKWTAWLASEPAQTIPLRFLDPPDGDEGFRRFRSAQAHRDWVSGDLRQVRDWVRASAGVITVDNFLGHLAAEEGKPVLWINGGSDPGHVRPYGAGTAVAQHEPMPCRPCDNRCTHPRFKACLADLDPATVNAAWRSLTAAAADPHSPL